MTIDEAIKTKLRLIDKEAEQAWRSDWNALYGQIDPAHLRTMRPTVQSFEAVTAQLIKIKAASMIVTTLEILSNADTDNNLQVELKNFVLSFFEDSVYIQRLTLFVDAVNRKFTSFGLAFIPEEWRIDLLDSAFRAGIMNTLRDARAGINADFAAFRARRPANHNAADASMLASISECVELKPNICGIGINLNAILGKILRKLKSGT